LDNLIAQWNTFRNMRRQYADRTPLEYYAVSTDTRRAKTAKKRSTRRHTPEVWDLPQHHYILSLPQRNSHPVGHGFLTTQASRSHSDTPNWVGFFWTSVQPNAETST